MADWGGPAELDKFTGVRADLSRLVARTQGRLDSYPYAHFVCIGLGDLGSTMTTEMTTSHQFESLTLVDGDTLEIDNVLRHSLGLDSVGLTKAEAMAKAVGRHRPWLDIETHAADVLGRPDDLEKWLSAADIIIRSALRTDPYGTPIHSVCFTADADEGHVVRYVVG